MSMSNDDSRPTGMNVSRRWLVLGAGSAAALSAAVSFGWWRGSEAQEATPEAAATPAAERQMAEGGAAPGGTPTATLPTMPPELEQYAGDWPAPNQNLTNHRNANTTIDSSNVATLGRAWALPLTVTSGFGAISAPVLILGDMLYTQDMVGNVYAINRADGSIKWMTEYDISTAGPNGVAVGYGMVFGGQGATAEAFALDAESGAELWRVDLSPNIYTGVDMSPIAYDGKLYISTVPVGGGGGSYIGGGKGEFFVLDASTGGGLWSFDTTSNLWGMPTVNSGGGLWYPPAIDEAGNIYFGTGNPAPFPGTEEYPNGSSRPGDNLYASSMVSLDPATGAIRWYIKPNARDLTDHDFMISPVVTDADINGTTTKLAIGAGKNGLIVAANADTGEELWRVAVGIHQNDTLEEYPADEPVEVYPGALGGVETPMAFADGVLYASLINMSAYATATGFDYNIGSSYQAASGEVVAIDVATGEVRWDVEVPTLPVAAATVANDLVFVGGIDGRVVALSTSDGSTVWTYQVPAGINAPLSIAGDTLIVPAGGPFIPEEGQFSGDPPATVNAIHLLQLGRAGDEAPIPQAAATPEAAGTPAAPEGQGVAAEATETAAEATPAASSGGGATLAVTGHDIYFEPKELSGPAGTDVAITLTNQGAAAHDIAFEEFGIVSKLLAPGESDTVTVNAPAGAYEYICTVPGHAAAGMVGTLTLS